MSAKLALYLPKLDLTEQIKKFDLAVDLLCKFFKLVIKLAFTMLLLGSGYFTTNGVLFLEDILPTDIYDWSILTC